MSRQIEQRYKPRKQKRVLFPDDRDPYRDRHVQLTAADRHNLWLWANKTS